MHLLYIGAGPWAAPSGDGRAAPPAWRHACRPPREQRPMPDTRVSNSLYTAMPPMPAARPQANGTTNLQKNGQTRSAAALIFRYKTATAGGHLAAGRGPWRPQPRNCLADSALPDGPFRAAKRPPPKRKTCRMGTPYGTSRHTGRRATLIRAAPTPPRPHPGRPPPGQPQPSPRAAGPLPCRYLRGLAHLSSIFSACSASASGAMPRNFSVTLSPPRRRMGV